MAYARRAVTIGLARLQAETFLLIDELIRDGAPGQAAEIRGLYFRFEDRLLEIAKVVAEVGDTRMRRELDRSIIQGRGLKNASDRSGLSEAITSHPLPGVPGSVGFASIEELDDKASWWWTQEQGTDIHVGRYLYGVFMDNAGGRYRPSQDQAGEHPIFAGKSSRATPSRGKPPQVQNPIPAKRFLQQGSESALQKWHVLIREAKAQFEAAVVAVASGAPVIPKGPRRRR